VTTRQELVRRPEARAEAVEDLVARVLRGEIRIPVFQRGLQWKDEHVLALFDSVYRGFPIGSLLLRHGPAPAKQLQIGPLIANGEETKQALWVVDGQQRITALAAALGRDPSLPGRGADPYVVYFDPAEQAFRGPAREGVVPSQWVPLPRLLDASALHEWVFAWPHSSDAELRGAVFEAGKRIREYKVPMYVIETDDEEVLRTIFHRVNNSGVSLSWEQVHDALYGHRGSSPSTLSELADQLEELGMGRPVEDDHLLPCLVALRGRDVTRSLGEHLRDDPRLLEGAVADALPVIREVLGFLRARAEIPHLRLLPYSTPLPVLTRFFRVHPEPSERSLTLLVRWVWRSFLGRAPDDRLLKRRGVSSVIDDEEASVQRLLGLLPAEPAAVVVGDHFDARSAHSRIILLAMASLRPGSLGGGGAIDVAALIRERDVDAFRPLFPLQKGITRSPSNRVLLPGRGSAAAEIRACIEERGIEDAVLRSHGISPDVAEAILDRDAQRAISLRSENLRRAMLHLGQRLAEWGRSDRPSIEYLLHLGAGS
jgi:hypothetical protein